MCKGIAILINDNEIVMNEKDSSHSKINKNEDNYLKVNVIYDDRKKEGYRIELDSHGEDQIKHYQELGMINKQRKIIPAYMERLKKFCKENEHKFFRLFCKYLQNAYIEGDQSNYSATIEGYQSNYSATIEGYQSNCSAVIKGYQNNCSATIEGYQDNCSATIKQIIIYNMKITSDKKLTKLIAKFSEDCKSWNQATLSNFIKWLKKK